MLEAAVDRFRGPVAGSWLVEVREYVGGGKPAEPTICMALTGDRLPKLDMVMAIVTGCGGGDEDKQRFASAWRAIRTGVSAREPGKPEPGDVPQAAMQAYGQAVLRRAFSQVADAS